MVWLVLAPEVDEAARWAAERLSGVGLTPLSIVTDVDLAGATWSHRLGTDGPSTIVGLTDGRTIDSADVLGTLNRLTHVPLALVAPLTVDDRTYALQELSALMMSWLASLPGPMFNPADTRGLSGAWRSPGEWALLVHDAGLSAAPLRIDSAVDTALHGGGWHAWPPYAPFAEDVIVIGDAVFASVHLGEQTIMGCRRLAANANTPLLGVDFADEDASEVIGVTPLPDLRAGGDELVTALAVALRSGGNSR